VLKNEIKQPVIEKKPEMIEEKNEVKEVKEQKAEVKEEKKEIVKEEVKRVIVKTNPMQEYTESNYHFLKLIIKWKYPFMIVTAAALIVSFIFSSPFFIKPKYKSFAIAYPANLTPYGTESAAEQLMQLFLSADVRNQVIKKFDLAKRYEIDTTSKGGVEALIGTYESNVTISRTQFESVEIKVLDEDAKVACDMVKEIIKAMNLKARALQRDKSKEVLLLYTNELNYKKKQLDSINDILNDLRQNYQILDYNSQAKELMKGYVKGLGKGKPNSEISQMMKNLEEKGGEYYSNIRIYDELLKGYSKAKLDYDEIWKDMNKELTYANMVTYPSVSDKKAYPIRSLIVAVSVVSADLFLFLIIVFLDSKKKYFQ